MIEPLPLFLLTLKSALLSTGGLGNVPILHDDLVPRGWATPRQFAEALAVGQVSPGPNGLWTVSLGYLVGGPVGAAATLLAICLPPAFVLLVERAYGRLRSHPAAVGALQGLNLAVIGVFGVVLVRVLTASRVDAAALAIVAASFALGATRRVPIPLILALAGAAGVLLR